MIKDTLFSGFKSCKHKDNFLKTKTIIFYGSIEDIKSEFLISLEAHNATNSAFI